MAKEVATEGQKKKKKPILLIAVILVVLIVGGAFAFFFLKKGSSNSAKNTQAQNANPEAIINDKNVHIKNLPSMIVNLADPSGDRYLKISLALVMNGKEKPKGAESSGGTLEDAAIKNAIITVISTKTSDVLLTLYGKEELKKQLIKAINNVLGEDAVRNIYFTDFIIQ
ncbi:Flagellar biosynthesis protein FliL [Desulfurella amilsii]|uniref:Flagellar protein FliL n=1 Tax=Desulfurella amilsii TaxID=1562698 RepID=A0A1X4XYJ0_9BACT|nr:flagellar basal body-associated FliL family protein [Desulfurella amilsii]OSS42583.1 Flagellar biosynthesis protein FliL [Desulfurella amilsii]